MPSYSAVIVVGDWSGDGHNITEKYRYKFNMSPGHVKEAYQVGTNMVGVNLSGTVAKEYGSSTLYENDYWALCKAGINVPSILKESEMADDEDIIDDNGKKRKNPPRYYLAPEDFAELWLAVAKLGNPGLEWTRVDEPVNTINIGGYGLFAP
jgi:hypothetical protein